MVWNHHHNTKIDMRGFYFLVIFFVAVMLCGIIYTNNERHKNAELREELDAAYSDIYSLRYYLDECEANNK